MTVKTLSKYNDRSRIAAKQTNKQTQRQRNWQTFRQRNKKLYLKIDAEADLQVNTRTKRGKQKIKNEASCSVVIEIKK